MDNKIKLCQDNKDIILNKTIQYKKKSKKLGQTLLD